MQAAQALECASEQHAQVAFLDQVYTRQDSIGLKPWTEYALAAGVTDTAGFLTCLKSSPKSRILEGREFGQSIDLNATPTVLVDGWRFVGVPDSTTMILSIRALLSGQSPVTGTTQH